MPRVFRGGEGGFPVRELWRHSLTVAALSSEIAAFQGLPQSLRDEAWLSGLLHDIGALALGSILPVEYGKLLGESAKAAEKGSSTDFAILERERFGLDHAEAGGILLRERWRLPDPVPEVAERHHDLEFDPDLTESLQRSTIHLVHVANGICMGFGVSWNPGGDRGLAFRESAWASLGLDLGKVEEIVERTKSSLGFAETLLSGGA
jgi:two-component system cell cycle response regulator